MTFEEQFFKRLLSDTKENFLKSPIYSEQEKRGEKWNYSVCGTPVKIGKGILLGINWGVTSDHDPQEEMPDGKDITSYNFIHRSRYFLEEYLLLDFNILNFNYTNLCFFRTPKERFLKPKDYEISTHLFKAYVDFVQPSWIFSLSNNNSKTLLKHGMLSNLHEFYDSEKKHKGIIANLWGHKYYSVPHPNARVKTQSRTEIWSQIRSQISLS